MTRHGFVIGIRPEKLDEYKRLHKEVWPEILMLLKRARVANYTIFHKDNFLFGVFDYSGNDLAADFASMNAEPVVQQWYTLCEPCQQPLGTRRDGEWWAEMDIVFHMD